MSSRTPISGRRFGGSKAFAGMHADDAASQPQRSSGGAGGAALAKLIAASKASGTLNLSNRHLEEVRGV
jgi:hypothetical protein